MYAAAGAAVGATALGSGWMTRRGLQRHAAWYACVSPSAPPGWVFGAAWTVLYVQQALTLAHSGRWSIHAPMLLLQVLWCALFFELRAPLTAWLTIVATTLWAVRYRAEFGPLLPAWLAFATALNTVALVRDRTAGCAAL